MVLGKRFGQCSNPPLFFFYKRHTSNLWFFVDNMEFLDVALYLFRCAIG